MLDDASDQEYQTWGPKQPSAGGLPFCCTSPLPSAGVSTGTEKEVSAE